jgi:hypothetical protein
MRIHLDQSSGHDNREASDRSGFHYPQPDDPYPVPVRIKHLRKNVATI